MTHLELENLASDYLEGQLETARRQEFEAHLEGCADCRELMADLRHTLELCAAAEEIEPAPWLVSKILLATIGERKPTLREKVSAFFQPALRPRVAYSVAMAVFSVSIIINAAGINLSELTLADLNPRNWAYQANRTGHLLAARAEKFFYDVRVVYEIESRLKQIRQDTNGTPEKGAPKSDPSPGKTTDGNPPMNPQMAEARSPLIMASYDPNQRTDGENGPAPVGTRRSSLR
jgi:putative zinc finger protein